MNRCPHSVDELVFDSMCLTSHNLSKTKNCRCWNSLFALPFKGPVIRATFFFNLHATLLRCKLKSVVARITAHLKHCHATKFLVASWSSMLQQVELAFTFFNTFFQRAITNVVAWQCLRWVVIRPTTLSNLATQQCCVARSKKMLPILQGLKVLPNSAKLDFYLFSFSSHVPYPKHSVTADG